MIENRNPVIPGSFLAIDTAAGAPDASMPRRLVQPTVSAGGGALMHKGVR